MSNGATFNGPTFNGDVGFQLDLSDDKQAFTASFSGLIVSLGSKGSAPIVSRAFSFALPLSGSEPGAEIPFAISGFAGSERGANAHLLFSVNNQTMAVDFPEDFERRLRKAIQIQSRRLVRASDYAFSLCGPGLDIGCGRDVERLVHRHGHEQAGVSTGGWNRWRPPSLQDRADRWSLTRALSGRVSFDRGSWLSLTADRDDEDPGHNQSDPKQPDEGNGLVE